MSNRVTITRTVFTPHAINNSGPSFGYRMYDDTEQTYDDSLLKEQLNLSDEELFLYISDYGNSVSDGLIDFLIEYGAGVIIDGNFYDGDWVVKTLDSKKD